MSAINKITCGSAFGETLTLPLAAFYSPSTDTSEEQNLPPNRSYTITASENEPLVEAFYELRKPRRAITHPNEKWFSKFERKKGNRRK